MKNIRKLIALILVAAALFAFAAPASADSMLNDEFCYVPTKVVVNGTTVTISGYFINRCTTIVKDVDSLLLCLYQSGEMVLDAYFPYLDYFRLGYMDRYYQTFVIYDVPYLNSGVYYPASDDLTVLIDCEYRMVI